MASLLVTAGCGFDPGESAVTDDEASEVATLLSPNPCTAVTMTSPAQDFTATVGVPIVLTGAATCPVGQTPEYQYWFKQSRARNWTFLPGYFPGSSSWTPPTVDSWCVTVVARAVGAPENYQVRASAKCSVPRCGNRVIEPGEECDDGNGINGDTCDNNCTVPRCGNGALDPGEECDDGNTSNDETCEADCTLPRCGNGIADAGEECDDGNTENGDSCDTNCTLPRCGNGASDPGEECDDGNAVNGDSCDINCTVPRCGNHVVDPGEACDDGNLDNTDSCDTSCVLIGLAYIKASNTGIQDEFGWSVAVSADGATMAVGAIGEASTATGVNGNQDDNSGVRVGAVYVYTRAGPAWTQQAYLKASNSQLGDEFGWSVALSADGSTLAVGAMRQDGFSGAAYVFTRSGTTWSQQAYLKAPSPDPIDFFGGSVALAGDGSTLAVGAHGEGSAATGIDGDPSDNSAYAAGAVYVFTRSGATWSLQAYVKASNAEGHDEFGMSVTLSADGSTLAAGAWTERSAATGVDGDQHDNSAHQAGAAYVFTRTGVTWTQQAYLKASNTEAGDTFGRSIALSADATTLAVGAFTEASAARGIDGNQTDNSMPQAGAVYVFTLDGPTWRQQAYIKASNTDETDLFGQGVALSADGTTLAVSAPHESSAAIGIGGNQSDNSALAAGAIYVFARSGPTWSQQAYVKATNTERIDFFAMSFALSADASTLAVCASGEDSATTGVGGDQADNTRSNAGAAYVYR